MMKRRELIITERIPFALLRKLAIAVVLIIKVEGFLPNFFPRVKPTRRTWTRAFLESSMKDESNVQDLYRTVAEQDPEWFENFVLEILGEGAVAADLVALAKGQQRRGGSEKQVETMKSQSPTADSAFNETVLEANITDVDNVFQEEKKDLLPSIESVSDTSDSFGIDYKGVASDANEVNVTAEQVSTKFSDTGTVSGKDNMASTALNQTGTAAKTNTTTTSSVFVVYRDSDSSSRRRVPLNTLTSLDYTEDDIVSLEPDALHLIVNDSIRKPSSGLPSRWKVQGRESEYVQIHLSRVEAEKAMSLASKSGLREPPSSDSDEIIAKPDSSTGEDPLSAKQDDNARVEESQSPAEQPEPVLEEAPAGELPIREETARESSPEPLRQPPSSRDDDLARAIDATTRALKKSRARKIAEADHSTEEETFEEDNEELVRKVHQRDKRIRAPRSSDSSSSGDSSAAKKRPPTRSADKSRLDQEHETAWPGGRRSTTDFISPDKKDETATPRRRRRDADIVSKEEKETMRPSQRRPKTVEKKSVEAGGSQRSGRERASRHYQTSNRSAEGMRPRRSIERSNIRDDGREKPMYNGRQARPKKEKGDPPPSSSGLWPDMETFRSLLRNEAGLRLRILGDDWKDIVRDESKWRHDLYKEWLWALHNGLGSPIVESRSDRMRRQRSEYGSFSKGPTHPPSRKPSKR